MSIGRYFVSGKTAEEYRSLYTKKEADRRIRLHGKQKAAIFFAAFVLSVVLSAVAFFVFPLPERGWEVMFTCIASGALLMYEKDKKVRGQAEKRKRQMEADHPKILNQYMLYYLAGMNPRTIWYSICKRYEERVAGLPQSRRYAYDEMIRARNMMEEGYSEIAAYDSFAERCDISYRSFAGFVKQTAVKGNAGLEVILYNEIDKAQRERNNRVRMQASEAETKLLIPMFMMLVVVLAVVLIPAFIGLNV